MKPCPGRDRATSHAPREHSGCAVTCRPVRPFWKRPGGRHGHQPAAVRLRRWQGCSREPQRLPGTQYRWTCGIPTPVEDKRDGCSAFVMSMRLRESPAACSGKKHGPQNRASGSAQGTREKSGRGHNRRRVKRSRGLQAASFVVALADDGPVQPFDADGNQGEAVGDDRVDYSRGVDSVSRPAADE